MDNHNYAFWGQSTGMTLESAGKEDAFIFFKCIKKKSDGSWEKFKKGEGKAIRISLEEIIMILQVLNKKLRNWTTYHTYKEEKTPISLTWENGKNDKLWVNIGDYAKMLKFPQIEILRMLLEHILQEKIRDATGSDRKEKKSESNSNNFLSKEKINLSESLQKYNDYKQNFNNRIDDTPQINHSTVTKSPNKTDIQGSIKGETEKALLIVFPSGTEQWVPKSKIHSNFSSTRDLIQSFSIENWILKKSGII